jgi:elongation factor G
MGDCMAAPETGHVRNIALVGQDGAGKTSFAEAMLHISGRTPRMGTTHDGKSYLDYDEEEIRRKFTLSTSIAPILYKDFKINLLDTSGQADFMGDTLASMQAVEMAMFVIDAVEGPAPMTDRLWREAEKMRLCRSVFINHIDRPGADFDTSMAILHARYGTRLGAVSIPIGVGADFKGVIDVLRMKARYFENGAERVEEIPAEYVARAENARDHLCDLVAEADDELMMKYLEGDDRLTQDELEDAFGKAIAQELFIPVFVGSTIIEQGISNIMDDICSYFPSPTAYGSFYTSDGESHPVTTEGEPTAFVFKTQADPFVGRLSYLKVATGHLEPGMELINARTGKKDRLGHLYVMMGKESTDVKAAKAGDIIVVPKLTDARTGDTLSESGDVVIEPRFQVTPQYPVAIEAVNKNEEDKLGDVPGRARQMPTRPFASSATRRRARPSSRPWAKCRWTRCCAASRSRQASRRSWCRCASRTARPSARRPRRRGATRSRPAAPASSAIAGCASSPTRARDTSSSTRSWAARFRATTSRLWTRACRGHGGGLPGRLPHGGHQVRRVYDGSYHPVDSNDMAFKTAAASPSVPRARKRTPCCSSPWPISPSRWARNTPAPSWATSPRAAAASWARMPASPARPSSWCACRMPRL